MAKTKRSTARRIFITGLLVAIPVAVTAILLIFLFNLLDNWLAPAVNHLLAAFGVPLPLGWTRIPGLGILATILLVFFLGLLGSNYLGRRLIAFGDNLMQTIPLVKNVYGGISQLVKALSSEEGTPLRTVVMLEFPASGIWTLGFVSTSTSAALSRLAGQELVNAVSGLFLLKKQKKGSFDLANSITIIALFYGVAGSKVLYVIENFSDFLSRPFETMFSPGGLTFYGGFLLVVVSIYFTTRKAGVPFFVLTDATVPGLMLGYGIARIGCHLAGDGDYGFPTTLPWGTDYSNGTYPPSIAFKDFPEITSKFPGGIVPDNTPCHPTPVYEFIICALIFWFLWSIRKKTAPAGKLFMMYLIFAGIERFAIEFLRPNPRILFGISEAQLIALALIALGLLGWWKFKTGSRITTAV